jgi:hypothetical protein
VAYGDCTVNGVALHTGDGASLAEEPGMNLRGESHCELVVFDLP